MSKKIQPFAIGTTIGDWTVIAQMEKPNVARGGHGVIAFSTVRCVCGAQRDLSNGYLRHGHSHGCGCTRGRKLGQSQLSHGKSYTPIYGLWASIKHRLAHSRAYAGIHMHEPWVKSFVLFEAFILSLGPKPTPEHSLDRIDPEGDYVPGNLRWADKATQAQNRTMVLCSQHGGRKHSASVMSAGPVYRLWSCIKYRLKTERSYDGIRMHGPWVRNFAAFEAFILSLGPKPTPEHSLDRIDPHGHYEPGNLRWADKKLQSENRRNNMFANLEANSKVRVGEKYDMLTVEELVIRSSHGRNWYCAKVKCDCGTVKVVHQKQLLSERTKSCGCYRSSNFRRTPKKGKPITVNGETHNIREWARRLGVTPTAIGLRIHKLGWDPVRAVTEGAKSLPEATIDGVTKTVAEWCKETGVDYIIALRRIHKGWDSADAVTRPTKRKLTVELNGKTMPLSEACRTTGIPYADALARLNHGWDPVRAVTEPVAHKGQAALKN